MGYAARHARATRPIKARARGIHQQTKWQQPVTQVNNPVVSSAQTPVTFLTSETWKGCRCFILGGGPSLRGFDYSKLKGELTIGVNKTFMVFSPTINYSMDLRFYDWLIHGDKKDGHDIEEMKIKWVEYHGIKVFPKPVKNFYFTSDITPIKKIKTRTISLDIAKGIFLGNNSGFGAMMLAIALGANPIYLLGMDMKVDANITHWHAGYPSQPPEKLVKRLKKQNEMFGKFALDIKGLGIEVVNLGPDSAMECFEKSTLSDVLERKSVMHTEPTISKEYPIVVSFYTTNTPYKEYADELVRSLAALGLDYEVEGITNMGNWQANVRYKPTLLRKMVEKYSDRGVLYVDCDAVFLRKPDLFLNFEPDFAVHEVDWVEYGRRQRTELLGGTIYCKRTNRVISILDKWMEACRTVTLKVWDQKLLKAIIGSNFYNLPPEYCCIFDTMGNHVLNPVIKHLQASRTLRRQV